MIRLGDLFVHFNCKIRTDRLKSDRYRVFSYEIGSAISFAMSSYIVLPMIAALFQAVHYGGALINIVIECSESIEI